MDIKQRLKQVLVEDLNLEDMTPEQIRDDEILFSQGIGLDSLDAVELATGRSITLTARECAFGYRDSVFKRGLSARTVITRVRFALPRPWQAVLGYLDLQRKMEDTGVHAPKTDDTQAHSPRLANAHMRTTRTHIHVPSLMRTHARPHA